MPITAIRDHGPTSLLAAVLVALMTVSAAPSPLSAQSSEAPTFASREQLTERAEEIERQLQTATLTEEGRARLQVELNRVRTRLDKGDFQPGDVVELQVWGNDELSGSFTVGNNTRLQLPSLSSVDLGGVLYAETEDVIREHLERYLQDVRFTVRPLKRVAVLGAVSAPGFYDLRPSASVSDALMAAGGPTQNAKLDDLALRREGRNVLDSDRTRSGEVQTMTLEQLDVRRGDQFYVPQDQGAVGFREIMGIVGAVGTTIWAVSRIF